MHILSLPYGFPGPESHGINHRPPRLGGLGPLIFPLELRSRFHLPAKEFDSAFFRALSAARFAARRASMLFASSSFCQSRMDLLNSSSSEPDANILNLPWYFKVSHHLQSSSLLLRCLPGHFLHHKSRHHPPYTQYNKCSFSLIKSFRLGLSQH